MFSVKAARRSSKSDDLNIPARWLFFEFKDEKLENKYRAHHEKDAIDSRVMGWKIIALCNYLILPMAMLVLNWGYAAGISLQEAVHVANVQTILVMICIFFQCLPLFSDYCRRNMSIICSFLAYFTAMYVIILSWMWVGFEANMIQTVHLFLDTLYISMLIGLDKV